MFEFVDPVTVLTAASAGFLSGIVWYGALGKFWLDAHGKGQEELRIRPLPIIVAAVANLITAYFLANLLAQFGADSGLGGMIAAAMIWLGFTITYIAMSYAVAGARFTLTIIDGFHALLGLCVMGYVIGVMSAPGQ